MDILIDFDGTCVSHDFPGVGRDIGAASVLRELVDNGHNLILFTMRSDRAELGETKDDTIQDVVGNFLTDAVNWFKENNIPLYGIQTNPTQHNWTTSPKAYGQMMIDDSALGCPLTRDDYSERPYVDWVIVRYMLMNLGVIKESTNFKTYIAGEDLKEGQFVYLNINGELEVSK